MPVQQNQPSQPQQQNQPNSITLIRVPSLDYIKNCNVPAGTFIHDTLPYMFIKTAPNSPIESAKISIYKLLEVDDMDDTLSNHDDDYVTRKEYLELKDSIASLEERINSDESVYRSSKKKWTNDGGSASTKPNPKSN
jgi:hypothetical protein